MTRRTFVAPDIGGSARHEHHPWCGGDDLLRRARYRLAAARTAGERSAGLGCHAVPPRRHPHQRRSGIVPRWIAVWGLIAIPAYGAAELVPMYEAMEPNSTVPVMLDFPMLLQELVLAVWMIARGFRPVTAHADG